MHGFEHGVRTHQQYHNWMLSWHVRRGISLKLVDYALRGSINFTASLIEPTPWWLLCVALGLKNGCWNVRTVKKLKVVIRRWNAR